MHKRTNQRQGNELQVGPITVTETSTVSFLFFLRAKSSLSERANEPKQIAKAKLFLFKNMVFALLENIGRGGGDFLQG
jgi:hypothetical protein